MVRPPFGTTVPGNRWDLVADAAPDPWPSVTVVVTHFEQPGELARTLAALARQDYPADLMQVVVADDGSAVAPDVPTGVVLVRQEDRGFRAAAVRNLGVTRATGDVLCFLDADTSPEPGYVRRMTRLPALLPETVTVGRRRHAELAPQPVDAPIETAGPRNLLPEPAWLSDAYERSRDLLDADDRSYRYIIGAAFACTRWFFDEIGGMDESFDEYGGEDWEWAHRAWQIGAIFAHVPDAVAWHDGPEWAGRMADPEERVRRGNVQTLLLTGRIPVDGSRGTGVLSPVADIAFRLRGRFDDAATFVCVDALLAAFPRARVELEHGAEAPVFSADPRVVAIGPASPAARVEVDLAGPVVLPADGALVERLRALGAGDEDELEIRSSEGVVLARASSRRSRERRARWGDEAAVRVGSIAVDEAFALRPHPRVEPHVGGWAGPDHLR
ncbi:galactosyltransferase-like protein [Microbacterium sp. AG1240]|uniref:glycosyltransferase family 2 protein n=1 Tax=Microbacterium sp. AG1240 TaxID=2183992 RepID=UPI000F27E53C|nr:glycosyltransferase [Microbacterium sp. AG1240]RKT33371.1 galactosyltransferase-like protein [Microbacterium sp. AG1240]